MTVSVESIRWPGPCHRDAVLQSTHSAWSTALSVEIPAAVDGRPTNESGHSHPVDDDALVTAAGRLGGAIPPTVDAALHQFADRSNHLGALLISDVPTGPVPPTPPRPAAPTDKDLTTELTLLAVARRLGQPVGYAPEHGGRIVQNLVPTPEAAALQMSTSSSSNLMFHTETAFHPHRPRYLALFCLRGNSEAHTTLASIFDIVGALPTSSRATTIETMFEPRFRTAVDASFLATPAGTGRPPSDTAGTAASSTDDELLLSPPHALLTGTLDEPTFVFDADLTVGLDTEAERTVHALKAAIESATESVVLDRGDLLVIDNNRAVHGRSPFAARFDGTDRWLQRAFVVSDLAPSAADRDGRVIVTEFGTHAAVR